MNENTKPPVSGQVSGQAPEQAPGQASGYATQMNVTHSPPGYGTQGVRDGAAPPPQQPSAQSPAPPAPNDGLIGGAANSADLIRNSDTDNFMHDVIEASASVPVIVDFWAPWCEPCKTLGPMLEKLVKRACGLVHMVKINVDENQELAQKLRVQSIPTVFAFKDGKPADAFQGALSESQLQAFIDKLTQGSQSPIDAALEQAQAALDGGDSALAEDIYSQIIAHDPTVTKALGGLIRAQATGGKIEEARETIAALDDKTLNIAEVKAAISALDLAEQSQSAGDDDCDALEAKLAKKENDHATRFELAQALYAKGNTAEAVEHLLYIVRTKRTWNDDAARKQLIKIFDTLGSEDPITVDGRQQLSIILFS